MCSRWTAAKVGSISPSVSVTGVAGQVARERGRGFLHRHEVPERERQPARDQPHGAEERARRQRQVGEIALATLVERREAGAVERGEAAIVLPLLLDHGVDAAHQRRHCRRRCGWRRSGDEQALHQVGLQHHDVFVDADAEQLVVAQPMLAMQAAVDRRVVELRVAPRARTACVRSIAAIGRHLHAPRRIGGQSFDVGRVEPAHGHSPLRATGRQP